MLTDLVKSPKVFIVLVSISDSTREKIAGYGWHVIVELVLIFRYPVGFHSGILFA